MRVHDIDTAKLSPLLALGAVAARSVQEAASGADVVMTSLPGPAQVETVAMGSDGLLASLRRGAVWVDFGTNDLETGRRIHALAADHGIGFLDAPVSGGDEGARAGNLTILVGGDEALFHKVAPVLALIGENVMHLGPGGAGYVAKIAQVILCYLHSLALAESLMLGISGGVEPAQMLSIIRNSTGRSYVADRYGPPILDGSFDPSFSLGLAHKDLKLAEDMAKSLDIELPMTGLTLDTYRNAMAVYGFNANHLEVARLLEEKNDVHIRG